MRNLSPPILVFIVISLFLALPASAGKLSQSQLKSKLKAKPDNISVREAYASSLFKSKNYDEVVKVLQPYSFDVSNKSRWNLTLAYKAIGKTKLQIKELEALSESTKNDKKVMHALAEAYSLDGQETKAVRIFRDLIAHNSKSVKAYKGLLAIFEKNNNTYESRNLLTTMKRNLGESPIVYNGLCRLYSEGGFLDQAISSCEMAMSLSPKHSDNHLYLAQSYLNKGEEQMTARIYSRSASQFKKVLKVQLTAGQYFLGKESYSVAARLFMTAVGLESKSPEGVFGYAKSLYELGQYKKALPYFIKACQLDQTKIRDFRSAGSKLLRERNSHARSYQSSLYKCNK